MHPTDEFLKHAAECEQMAKFTHDHGYVEPYGRSVAQGRCDIHKTKLGGTSRYAGEATPECRTHLGPSVAQ